MTFLAKEIATKSEDVSSVSKRHMGNVGKKVKFSSNLHM